MDAVLRPQTDNRLGNISHFKIKNKNKIRTHFQMSDLGVAAWTSCVAERIRNILQFCCAFGTSQSGGTMANESMEALPSDFPRDEVLAALDQWWNDELMDSVFPGDDSPPPDIMKPSVEIDSHRAVRALVTLEEVVKFEIPESVIKEGGYDSFEEMKALLIFEVTALYERKWKKEHA